MCLAGLGGPEGDQGREQSSIINTSSNSCPQIMCFSLLDSWNDVQDNLPSNVCFLQLVYRLQLLQSQLLPE